MNTDSNLKNELNRIHRKGYPAYKDLKGSYRFPAYILHIDHVQGDPFAAPSKLSVEVPQKQAAFPEGLFDASYKRIALQDHLTRTFGRALSAHMFEAKGSGKSGLMSISRPGQQVLERTALQMDKDRIIARFEVGFPANGRTINAVELEKILFRFLSDAVKRALYYRSYDKKDLYNVVHLAEDQHFIREELIRRNLTAFVANGSVLPRESGVSDRPMRGAVAFTSPKSMEIEMDLPHKGSIRGMGIPRGITLIVGGGYHGKSTLLKALELGVYNHIEGDGREYVITDETAMKIRAEDGRAVSHVNISPFINHLPNGKDTVEFSTEDASGSTSQAANVVEAVDSGAKALLIDEDTSATNFMVRDTLMQSVIAKDKEPITPFLDRARDLYEKQGVSVILVAGSSGAFFYIADHILQMDTYRALDITEKVREICPHGESQGVLKESTFSERMTKSKANAPNLLIPESPEEISDESESIASIAWKQTDRTLRVGKIDKKHDQIRIKQFGKDSFSVGRDTVDLKYVEQIADAEQTTTLSYIMRYVIEQLEKKPGQEIGPLLEAICKEMRENGPGIPGRFGRKPGQGQSRGTIPGNLAAVRPQEIYACVNRYRGFKR